MADNTRGPLVAASENLWRVITCPAFWDEERGGPSSAAFSHPVFSVDVASRTNENASLRPFIERGCEGAGLVEFNCGDAAALGFSTHDEKDPQFPENEAHAQVYCDFGVNQRKKRARRLVDLCRVRRRPSFESA